MGVLFAGGLADNGGSTQTIALRDAPDNPALGRGDPDPAPTTDQRGLAAQARKVPTPTSVPLSWTNPTPTRRPPLGSSLSRALAT